MPVFSTNQDVTDLVKTEGKQSTRFAEISSTAQIYNSSDTDSNKTGNIWMNVTMRQIGDTIFATKKQ
jgi:hypothetical protein